MWADGLLAGAYLRDRWSINPVGNGAAVTAELLLEAVSERYG